MPSEVKGKRSSTAKAAPAASRHRMAPTNSQCPLPRGFLMAFLMKRILSLPGSSQHIIRTDFVQGLTSVVRPTAEINSAARYLVVGQDSNPDATNAYPDWNPD